MVGSRSFNACSISCFFAVRGVLSADAGAFAVFGSFDTVLKQEVQVLGFATLQGSLVSYSSECPQGPVCLFLRALAAKIMSKADKQIFNSRRVCLF